MATEAGDEAPDATGPRSVRTEDVLGGKPRFEGRRIGVRFRHERAEEPGAAPRAVADGFDLAVADAYHALAYYHEHPETARVEREREEALEQRREKATTPDGLG